MTVGRGTGHYRESGVQEEVRPEGTSPGKRRGERVKVEGTVCAKALRQELPCTEEPEGLWLESSERGGEENGEVITHRWAQHVL